MEVLYNQALEAAYMLQNYCNHFAMCSDCPLLTEHGCAVNYPSLYTFVIIGKEENNG